MELDDVDLALTINYIICIMMINITNTLNNYIQQANASHIRFFIDARRGVFEVVGELFQESGVKHHWYLMKLEQLLGLSTANDDFYYRTHNIQLTISTINGIISTLCCIGPGTRFIKETLKSARFVFNWINKDWVWNTYVPMTSVRLIEEKETMRQQQEDTNEQARAEMQQLRLIEEKEMM